MAAFLCVSAPAANLARNKSSGYVNVVAVAPDIAPATNLAKVGVPELSFPSLR